jgi:hypothetical protein
MHIYLFLVESGMHFFISVTLDARTDPRNGFKWWSKSKKKYRL